MNGLHVKACGNKYLLSVRFKAGTSWEKILCFPSLLSSWMIYASAEEDEQWLES